MYIFICLLKQYNFQILTVIEYTPKTRNPYLYMAVHERIHIWLDI